MKITKMINQHRRDFTAEITCENCNNKQILDSGYDDDYYHTKVLPNMKCASCNESTISINAPIEPQATKYPEGFQI